MRLRYKLYLFSMLAAVFCLTFTAYSVTAGQLNHESDQSRSFDPQTWRPADPGSVGPIHYGRKGPDLPPIMGGPPLIAGPIDAFDFDTNGAFNGGFRFIPPDVHDAVGPDHVINIGNVLIEWRLKNAPAVTQHIEALSTFFGAIPAPLNLGTFMFDPKVIYDQYADRFVVVALEQTDATTGVPDLSRIHVAISKTSDPNAGWWFHSIDAKLTIGGIPSWADYPGLAIDDKAVYITVNYFGFFSFGAPRTGHRLWIVHKTPIYGGPDQSAVTTVHDPIAKAGAGFDVTAQPAHMYGPLPLGTTGKPLGTYLVGYSGITFGGVGGLEAVQVFEVTDPLGAGGGPFFVHQFVTVGDIEDIGGVFGFPALPDAPQSGSPALIEVNDRRALNAVWRDNCLYASATIRANAAPDAGQTTAHWFQFDTSFGPPALLKLDEGNVGAEDLGVGTYTFFPSVMIDCNKNMAIGFSASNTGIFCGAYYTGRFAFAPAGTVQPTVTLKAGTDFYLRTFGGTRNRWGDYSGLALCPVDEATFWVYNEYACTRGTIIAGEDGRWCTAIGSFRLKTTVAVAITSFAATVSERGVELRSEFASDLHIDGINLYRGDGGAEPLLLRQLDVDDGGGLRYLDTDVELGMTYSYQIGVRDRDGEVYSQIVKVTTPKARLALGQNTPNPFNPTTTINYSLPSSQHISLRIYDAAGRLVRNLFDGTGAAGSHDLTWDGTNNRGAKVTSGVYYYKLTAGTVSETRKMVLLK